ncbi:diguanylate cyclase domain-containing protein [Oceanithermus sp.]
MEIEKKLVTNLTFLDRLVSGSLDRQRRALIILVLFIGSLASALAFWLEIVIDEVNIVDLIFLPSMTVLFAIMGVGLIRNPARRALVEKVAYTALIFYALSMLIYQIRVTVPNQHTFSEVMLWYPMIYLAAFLLHRRATAMRTAMTIWLVSLLIGLVFTPYRQLLDNADASAFNSLFQFYVSGITYILLLYAFSRIEEGYAETRVLAYIDYLTQLPNRRYGESMLVQLLRQARENSVVFSVIMIDLDGFKRVNDHFGHDVGDQVLKRCALQIQRYLPRGARVIRWGGEEFLVVLPNYDEERASKVAEEIRRELEGLSHESVGAVQASFGVAGFRNTDTLEELIMRADRAMYRAKKLGGNRVVAASTLSMKAEI